MAKVHNSALPYVPAPHRIKGLEHIYFGHKPSGDGCPVVVNLRKGKTLEITWEDLEQYARSSGFITNEDNPE